MDVLTQPASAEFLLGLLWNSDNDGDMFLRNVGISANYTALQSKNRTLRLDNSHVCSQLI
jgi:hypothetical protein